MKNTIYIFAFLLMGSASMPNAWAQYSTNGTAQDTIVVATQDTIAVASKDTAGATGITIDTNVVQFEDLFSATKVTAILFVLIFTFLFNRLLVFLLSRLAENQPAYRLLIKRIIPFLNVGIWTIAIFFVISGIIDPPIETVLTVGASIGLAIGFASQDILKNIFGGFIIILDSPFQVGDKIEIDGMYGEVTEIGLRSTRIVTPDDSLISLPNADIVNNAVSNSNTGELYCQVVASIYLPSTVNIAEMKEIAYKAAITSRYVYMNKPVVVNVENTITERMFAVQLKVKAYVLDIRYEFLLKSEITELILTEINRRKAIQEAKAESVETK
ncbi:MAG: mechanosensitive ion channel domain-containing protein [Balneolaceae bacterium]